jgi:hypothetical protein
MGWRDRVKKGFGDFEDIEKGIKNLKTTEKERKEGFKTTFIPPPHNTQNPQNRKNEGKRTESLRPNQTNIDRMVKSKKIPPAPAEIPAPEPAGLGAEHDRLWNEAWCLAEWIDNPEGAPIEDRRARLPELDRMRERMAEIVRQASPAGPDPETSSPGTWYPWKSTSVTRDTNPESCPARCRRTGECYSRAYFEGKPGKVKDCELEDCTHT